ncbi:hypothetical protein BDW66DRAFT_149417 [Aspergillus desertorum]
MLNLIEKVLGRTSAGAESVKVAEDPELASLATKRLYLYGKGDQIILWSDIEAHVAKARRNGWAADCAVSGGSGHVEHMRKHPVAYWKAIKEAWEGATSST